MKYNLLRQGDPTGKHSFGLINRTFPTIKDYSPNSEAVREDLAKIDKDLVLPTSIIKEDTKRLGLKESHSNEKFLTPIKDQWDLGSCVKFSTHAVAEGMFKKATNKTYDLSELYGYYEMRYTIFGIEENAGDTGGWLRSGLETLVRCGAPPTFVYPYDTSKFEDVPSRRADKYADDFVLKEGKYFRLDAHPYSKAESIIERMKLYISKGFLLCTGFDCYESLMHGETDITGDIPYPSNNESMIGGHAVCIYGYDDKAVIKNPLGGISDTTGAFLIKNSWGVGWGEGGKGKIPYEYYRTNLANDTWTITAATIVDSNKFG